MGVLGRGLASLIPNRNRDDYEEYEDDEILEERDAVGDDAAVEVAQEPQAEEIETTTVAVLEDFDEIDEMESDPAPQKPLVTPIPFDMETLMEEDETVSVSTEDDDGLDEAEVDEEGDIEEIVEDVPAEPEVTEPEAKEEEPAIPDLPKAVPAKATRKAVPAAAAVHQRGAAMTIKKAEKPVTAAKKPAPAVPVEKAAQDVSTIVGESWDQHEDSVQHVAIGDIKINPLQPRRMFDPVELEELKDSIERHGILQPLVVRRLEDGYELIAGERRLRAAKTLEWTKVPCVVRRDVQADQSRLVYALIENIQRENLNPMEEARAYEQLNKEYGLTHEEIGERVGKSRVRITNAMRVIHLPAEIQRGLSDNKITMGHAKAILMIPDSEKQLKFYHHLIEEGLTVRKAETRARRIQRSMNITDAQRRRIGTRHPLALRYTPMLEDRYGYDAKVKFVEAKNRFEIVFKAHNQQEMEELCGRLLGTAELPTVDEFE